ncbi:hypothetical protein ES703_72414 [subsurface metagenome]
MKIIEVGLRGLDHPVQLPNYQLSDKGMLLLRPSGSDPMYIGSSSIEINLPLPDDRAVRLYPANSNELYATGSSGETLHAVLDRE